MDRFLAMERLPVSFGFQRRGNYSGHNWPAPLKINGGVWQPRATLSESLYPRLSRAVLTGLPEPQLGETWERGNADPFTAAESAPGRTVVGLCRLERIRSNRRRVSCWFGLASM